MIKQLMNSKHNVSSKLLKENDGHMRIVMQEFVEWGIMILNIVSKGVKKALIKHKSLKTIVNKCQTDLIPLVYEFF